MDSGLSEQDKLPRKYTLQSSADVPPMNVLSFAKEKQDDVSKPRKCVLLQLQVNCRYLT